MDRIKDYLRSLTVFEWARLVVIGLFLVAVCWGVSQYVVLPGKLPSEYSLDLAGQDLVVFTKYDKGQVVGLGEADDQLPPELAHLAPQDVEVKILTGDIKGQVISVKHQIRQGDEASRIQPGDKVVLGYYEVPGESNYVVIDRYRLPSLAWLGLLFGVLVLVVARWRGFASLVAMAFSLGVLYFAIAPNILVGRNPILVTILGSLVVLLVSIFLSHGFSRKTTLAFFATVVALLVSVALSEFAVYFTKVFGSGDGDALFLQSSLMGVLNLRGLFLAGVIIGTLGILDDVTTTQVSSVKELSEVSGTLSPKELFSRGMSIGKDHIAAIVNTLIFAYAGVAMPLFLLIVVNISQPVWVMINSEPIAEELVRMLVGSATLVLAVPLATFIAAAWYGRKSEGKTESVLIEETIVVVEE